MDPGLARGLIIGGIALGGAAVIGGVIAANQKPACGTILKLVQGHNYAIVATGMKQKMLAGGVAAKPIIKAVATIPQTSNVGFTPTGTAAPYGFRVTFTYSGPSGTFAWPSDVPTVLQGLNWCLQDLGAATLVAPPKGLTPVWTPIGKANFNLAKGALIRVGITPSKLATLLAAAQGGTQASPNFAGFVGLMTGSSPKTWACYSKTAQTWNVSNPQWKAIKDWPSGDSLANYHAQMTIDAAGAFDYVNALGWIGT